MSRDCGVSSGGGPSCSPRGDCGGIRGGALGVVSDRGVGSTTGGMGGGQDRLALPAASTAASIVSDNCSSRFAWSSPPWNVNRLSVAAASSSSISSTPFSALEGAIIPSVCRDCGGASLEALSPECAATAEAVLSATVSTIPRVGGFAFAFALGGGGGGRPVFVPSA